MTKCISQTGISVSRLLRNAVLLALTGFAATSVRAAEAYVTYDTFNGQSRIDLTRWRFAERTRVSVGSVLSMVQRDIGSQVSDTGTLPTNHSTSLTIPSAVTQMRVSMAVNDASVTGCATNPTASTVEARMIGSFFNTAAPTPGDRTNDVLAFVRMQRASNSIDSAGVLRVQGFVVRCQNSDCSGSVEVIGAVDMGTANFGEFLSVRMEWEQSSKRFNFFRATDPVQRVSYVYADSMPPGLPFKNLQTRTALANCLNHPATEGFIDAKFDNVSVNASAMQ